MPTPNFNADAPDVKPEFPPAPTNSVGMLILAQRIAPNRATREAFKAAYNEFVESNRSEHGIIVGIANLIKDGLEYGNWPKLAKPRELPVASWAKSMIANYRAECDLPASVTDGMIFARLEENKGAMPDDIRVVVEHLKNEV